MTDLMTEAEVTEALIDADAIRTGHFALTSGRHSGTYVQCARILENPGLTTRLARSIASGIPVAEYVDLVVAPAVGGIVIGFAVAQALGVDFIFTERENGEMTLRRSFMIPPEARVLIVEDVVTTGGSVAEVARLVEAASAAVVGVAALIDRGGPKDFAAPMWPQLRLEVESWDPASCALCAQGLGLDSPGSRRIST
jgi:orotate phosphoribosyltransferase